MHHSGTPHTKLRNAALLMAPSVLCLSESLSCCCSSIYMPASIDPCPAANCQIMEAGKKTATMMDSRLLDAAVSGDTTMMKHLALHDPAVLLGTTPRGNTCLHISAMHGHAGFCMDAMALNRSLLSAVNNDGETPLVAAVRGGRTSTTSLAPSFLRCYRDLHLSEAILKQDKQGNNALHHAIRSGHRELALELIAAEPALSKAVNKYDESPMYIAVMRNYKDVSEKLLEIPDSAHLGGTNGHNALHAAVRNGTAAIAKKIVETRPALALTEDKIRKATPLHQAVLWDKVDVLRVILEHDRSLGYVVSSKGTPLLVSAAYRGNVGVARELLKHCPDAPFAKTNGWTCLHQAVWNGQLEFVDFVLGLPQFGRFLINMRDQDGDTALHLAVQKSNPKMVAALLLHRDIDVRVLNDNGNEAIWKLWNVTKDSKTLNWNEISMLMLKADPQAATDIYNLRREAHDKVTETTRNDIKSLTQTYTGNTSLVAILIATITFAAAFTLPGGYSADPGNEGLPIMARKFAFKAFLISDTLAMCSSLVVAFVCIIARLEDLEFLLHYRSFTKKLMWFAYMATTTAFATGLYTVLAPRLLWLAVAICVLTTSLPILTKLLGEWPILRLRLRLGRTFKSDLLDMV
ncbi:ankyrin repeat-containing protein At5g02620 isoform X2 [Sorghum bicolor]|nr:ankyrin repeat-containing protein At5g02620 isoform X2 [Sorghum bicolor]XP_021316344.1 ankyrin repeat-containing protein At5g02620 isoform X2 [Sorghum bicolor]XP_021316345.1 ankyrin repeat-containing protein At5g02620 isoform X2 [Sorghum bicolor]XP_021316346.1 ankyrin repeat-containing protein At5g02620 isoform X2 [Sorghum bicolor]XP_021316347.1 ankyrin repeat-containing protein At5g02620 isoform X2 [Sorghum bicolor]XP_021316348.1 ankyrin repeat-containing protein At5g02620 isoform X2 [Sorg|eukprot:XP_021316343.1 ankyrin repeat-containing protein At5g02620 isoform X2 [Sorghum bicolor]